jgi:transposase
MEVLIETCCGLDVHQATVVACVLSGSGAKRAKREIRTFGTVARELTAMCEWLKTCGVTHVGMEATGVYWIPVYRTLEGQFEIVVGNAAHMRNVPGRKTDVKDSEWIADLVRHGLVRPSFVPPPVFRELRELTRYRRKLTQDQTRERNRIQKLLETAGIKLASVASDVFGASGRAMLDSLVAGNTEPAALARMARGKLRKKIPALVDALEGRFEAHHRYLLGLELRRFRELERVLDELDAHIKEKLAPFADKIALLQQIPGVDRVLAASMLAELGDDMSVFPTADHAAAWAGISPGNNESGGKQRRAKARRGNVNLLTTLVLAATGARARKGTYYREKYWRLKARLGPMRALFAIGRKILLAAYHMLRDGVGFAELGANYLAQRSTRSKRTLVKQLEALGFKVTLEKTPA